MVAEAPKECENPIIIGWYPQGNDEYRIICGFCPYEDGGVVKSSCPSYSMIYASNTHSEAKEYHFTQKLQADKGYFYSGEKVYDLQGNEKIGYFGYPQKSVPKISPFLWDCSIGLAIFAVVLFIIYSIKKPRIEGEMEWWQELLFILCIATLGIFYSLLLLVFLMR